MAGRRRPAPARAREGLERPRKPAGGYLTKRTAQHRLDEILADARRGQLLPPLRPSGGVSFADAAAEWLRYVEYDRRRGRRPFATTGSWSTAS